VEETSYWDRVKARAYGMVTGVAGAAGETEKFVRDVTGVGAPKGAKYGEYGKLNRESILPNSQDIEHGLSAIGIEKPTSEGLVSEADTARQVGEFVGTGGVGAAGSLLKLGVKL